MTLPAQIRTALPVTTIPPLGGISTTSWLGRPITSPWRMRIVAGAVMSLAARRYPLKSCLLYPNSL